MDQANRRCTVQRPRGDFCDAPSSPDMPFPICSAHAVELFLHMREMVIAGAADRARVADVLLAEQREDLKRAAAAAWRVVDRQYADAMAGRPRNVCVVYYARLNNQIKIGCSLNLMERLKTYPPGTVLLATEPGYREVEQARHRQFARARLSGEWFTADPDLLAFIETLQPA